jgi:hypothetical protein
MKNNFVVSAIGVLLLVSIYSCSVVKNPLASNNFKRVKYSSHLKYSKSKVVKEEVASTEKKSLKTVQSFAKESRLEVQSTVVASNLIVRQKSNKMPEANYSDAPAKAVQSTNFLQKISQTKVEEGFTQKSATFQKRDNWWEDDIEDWPWLEIVLALIAFLLVIIIVSLLFNALGGLVSSLLGLILLLIIAYILYTLWF